MGDPDATATAATKLAVAVTRRDPDFDAAFPDLYRSAYRVAYRLLGRRVDAEDVAAEALARTCEQWRRLVRRGDPMPWVVRVAANLAIDVARRRGRRPESAPPIADPATTNAAGHAAVAFVDADLVVDERMVLTDALRRLPKRQREVVVLRYLCDVSEADTAAALRCSSGTVKQHATRGLTTLRRRLEAEGYR